ncbi:MAG: alanyl-tRNA editing protein [Nitrososphaerales archaeon]
MTELLYLDNHYLKEFDATIIEVPDSKSIVLDRTAVYPRGGGQPSDRASLTSNGSKFEIIESSKSPEKVTHQLSNEVTESQKLELLNSKVHVVLDWELRYKLMRHHTSLHILSGVVFQRFNAKITGGQIYPERARLDLALSDLSKERQNLIETEMNRIVSENRQVRTEWLSVEEALNRSELYRLSADLLPRGVDRLRVVEIVGFDSQLDGGTHVARTGEIGRIRISKTENKGKDNKRIEIVLE